MDLSQLKKALADEPAYRYRQVEESIYQKLIGDWQEATNLSKDLRERLTNDVPLDIAAQITDDGPTRKAIITLNDGAVIEAVRIKNADGRNTICVSSQAGCALGCAFCATGREGFKRNLTSEEIVLQVLLFARELKQIDERVDNVVFMGMGEPFLNWENVSEAINVFNSKNGLNIAARSISISTCGITSGIRALIKFPLQVNLALSLHAPSDQLREELMPIAKKYSIKNLWGAVKDYLVEKNRKIMIEYLMIDGVNDAAALAEKLAELLDELPKHLVMVNLIPYNPPLTKTSQTRQFEPSTYSKITSFKNILGRRGFEATVRESLGGRIAGACGQLAGRSTKK
jgi:23S rRNA (adenine2503-C2)-methyltransferase